MSDRCRLSIGSGLNDDRLSGDGLHILSSGVLRRGIAARVSGHGPAVGIVVTRPFAEPRQFTYHNINEIPCCVSMVTYGWVRTRYPDGLDFVRGLRGLSEL